MSVARYMVGDVFQEMAKIPDGSIDLLVTSPPFLALRSYLPSDHPSKHLEIGSEATPAAFLTTLLALTREWRRVLAPHGSICVELGDTYSGTSGSDGDAAIAWRADNKGKHGALPGQRLQRGAGWPLDKSLCLLPTLYPASLAYGRNLLNPDDVIDPWRIRNLIVWHRPNPPVGALGDKVRPSTSYVTIAAMRRDRWFDLDVERTDSINPQQTRKMTAKGAAGDYESRNRGGYTKAGDVMENNPAGAPPLDYWRLDEDDPAEHLSWTIPTQPYAGAHYATFPIALPRRLIRLMCPQHVCRQCGEPRRRITTGTEYVDAQGRPHEPQKWPSGVANGKGAHSVKPDGRYSAVRLDGGWSDCGHDDYRRGIVCDPFAGSGTTLAAAAEQGRDSIGIDLDESNLDLARQRVGLFLEEAE